MGVNNTCYNRSTYYYWWTLCRSTQQPIVLTYHPSPLFQLYNTHTYNNTYTTLYNTHTYIYNTYIIHIRYRIHFVSLSTLLGSCYYPLNFWRTTPLCVYYTKASYIHDIGGPHLHCHIIHCWNVCGTCNAVLF